MTHKCDIPASETCDAAAVDAHQGGFTWRVLDIGDDLVSISVHRHQIPGVSVQHQPPDRQHTRIKTTRKRFGGWKFFVFVFVFSLFRTDSQTAQSIEIKGSADKISSIFFV